MGTLGLDAVAPPENYCWIPSWESRRTSEQLWLNVIMGTLKDNCSDPAAGPATKNIPGFRHGNYPSIPSWKLSLDPVMETIPECRHGNYP